MRESEREGEGRSVIFVAFQVNEVRKGREVGEGESATKSNASNCEVTKRNWWARKNTAFAQGDRKVG